MKPHRPPRRPGSSMADSEVPARRITAGRVVVIDLNAQDAPRECAAGRIVRILQTCAGQAMLATHPVGVRLERRRNESAVTRSPNGGRASDDLSDRLDPTVGSSPVRHSNTASRSTSNCGRLRHVIVTAGILDGAIRVAENGARTWCGASVTDGSYRRAAAAAVVRGIATRGRR